MWSFCNHKKFDLYKTPDAKNKKKMYLYLCMSRYSKLLYQFKQILVRIC